VILDRKRKTEIQQVFSGKDTLDAEKAANTKCIEELTAKVEELKKPRRSPLEQTQDERLKKFFVQYGDQEKSVLNYLAMHQVIVRTDRSTDFPLISGVAKDRIWDILRKLHNDDMVSQNTEHPGNGWKETWRISQGAMYTLNQELRAKDC